MRTAEDKKYEEKYRVFRCKPQVFTCRKLQQEEQWGQAEGNVRGGIAFKSLKPEVHPNNI
jgi:hypothetical protein